MKINKIEDIYPLTIICMRHGKFAIIEGNSYFDCVHELEDNEEYQYDPHTFMIKKWEHINYGIGTDIQTAFEDFKKRYK